MREAKRILKSYRKKLRREELAPLAEALAGYESALDKSAVHDVHVEFKRLQHLIETDFVSLRKSVVREWVEALLLAAVIALVLRSFVMELFTIPSGSMISTLMVGDKIVVSKLHYGIRIPLLNKHVYDWAEPARGDIIVFVYPVKPELDFIKRVIGLPGDKIVVEGTTVSINGRLLDTRNPRAFTYVDESSGQVREPMRYDAQYGGHHFNLLYENDRLHPRSEYTVPAGHLFVMGDNRDNSADSREWGFVPLDNVKGRALMVLMSYSEREGLRSERIGHLLD